MAQGSRTKAKKFIAKYTSQKGLKSCGTSRPALIAHEYAENSRIECAEELKLLPSPEERQARRRWSNRKSAVAKEVRNNVNEEEHEDALRCSQVELVQQQALLELMLNDIALETDRTRAYNNQARIYEKDLLNTGEHVEENEGFDFDDGLDEELDPKKLELQDCKH